MTNAVIEHVNVTVSDPHKPAKVLSDLFDWHIRWEGVALNGGYTIHVGTDTSYVAVYTPKGGLKPDTTGSDTLRNINHIGVVVDDLDTLEEHVKAAGFTPHNHGDYEPGKRFYFHDHDGVEYEVVSYT